MLAHLKAVLTMLGFAQLVETTTTMLSDQKVTVFRPDSLHSHSPDHNEPLACPPVVYAKRARSPVLCGFR